MVWIKHNLKIKAGPDDFRLEAKGRKLEIATLLKPGIICDLLIHISKRFEAVHAASRGHSTA